jgi:glutamate/tyrosine decarboxylase-like PLP-dependent enzyme
MADGPSGDNQLLLRAYGLAASFLAGLRERPVGARAGYRDLLDVVDSALPEAPQDPSVVLDALASAADPGLVACAGPRYFGFVTGGAHPVALAAEWLVSAWDQNAGLSVMSPAASVIEEVTARWLIDLLGLPAGTSVGFTTGAHTASITALAAARHDVLKRVGWDVEADGLQDAPPVHVVVGAQTHVSIAAALRLLGFGAARLLVAEADAQGRMLPSSLADRLERCDGPTIVCAQAGNVNTGAFDPFDELVPLTRAHGAWLHVDGAFGMWAAAVPELRARVRGIESADSWSTDAHKWLNVPYDSGIVCVAHPAAHRAAMSMTAAYLLRGPAEERNGMDWVPESSRRARAIPIYATLRALGRRGVSELVIRCCALATRMADRLREAPGITIQNDVVLNQVLVRFDDGDADLTSAVIAGIQRDGVCWVGGTTWQGQPAMRISISGWCTREEDIDRSAESIVRALNQAVAETDREKAASCRSEERRR